MGNFRDKWFWIKEEQHTFITYKQQSGIYLFLNLIICYLIKKKLFMLNCFSLNIISWI